MVPNQLCQATREQRAVAGESDDDLMEAYAKTLTAQY